VRTGLPRGMFALAGKSEPLKQYSGRPSRRPLSIRNKNPKKIWWACLDSNQEPDRYERRRYVERR
jgi:hypothetical protein